MNKTSTAVYMLIAIALIVVAFSMAKPAIYAKGATEPGSYIKLWNFKKLA